MNKRTILTGLFVIGVFSIIASACPCPPVPPCYHQTSGPPACDMEYCTGGQICCDGGCITCNGTCCNGLCCASGGCRSCVGGSCEVCNGETGKFCCNGSSCCSIPNCQVCGASGCESSCNPNLCQTCNGSGNCVVCGGDPHKFCCGGSCGDSDANETCCDNKTIYNYDTKKCCGDGDGHTCDSNQTCCYGGCCPEGEWCCSVDHACHDDCNNTEPTGACDANQNEDEICPGCAGLILGPRCADIPFKEYTGNINHGCVGGCPGQCAQQDDVLCYTEYKCSEEYLRPGVCHSSVGAPGGVECMSIDPLDPYVFCVPCKKDTWWPGEDFYVTHHACEY